MCPGLTNSLITWGSEYVLNLNMVLTFLKSMENFGELSIFATSMTELLHSLWDSDDPHGQHSLELFVTCLPHFSQQGLVILAYPLSRWWCDV